MEQLTTADRAFEAAMDLLQCVPHSSEEAWKRATASALQLFEQCVQVCLLPRTGLRESVIAAKAFPDLQIHTQLLCKGNQRLGQSHDALGRLLVQVGHVIQPMALSACKCIYPVSICMQLGDIDGAKPHMIAAFDAVAAAYPSGSPVVAHQHSILMQLYPDAKPK